MIAELKPYPEMKDSGVEWLGEVPEHWKVLRLKSWLEMNGVVLPEDTDPDYMFDYLDIGSVATGQLTAKPERLQFENSPSRARRVLRSGDTIVSTVRTYLKAIWHVDDLASDLIASTGFAVLTPRSGTFPRFVSYSCQSDPFTDRVTAESVGIAYPAIAETRLATFKVSVPPLSEQTAIVRYLDYADRRIRRYIRAKEKLVKLLEEERKNATLEAIHSPSTTSQRLEAVADLIKRPLDRANDDKEYTPIGLYNRGRGIFKKEPRNGSDLGDSDFFWVDEGDLIISGQFAWEGAIALASTAECDCVASHRYPILRGKRNVLDSGFLLAFFQTDWGQLLLDHHSRGAAGRNRPLNPRTLLKEKISLPPLRSQLRVVEMLQRESHTRRQVARLTKKLSEYRTRLIADVVTGKLDVREAAARLPDEAEEPEPVDKDTGPTDLGLTVPSNITTLS